MSVIFNEPGGGQTLSNPSQQNNVFQFVQTTKPTERSAGVALVAGDRWYKTDDQTEWSWNGTYWLSPRQIKSTTSWLNVPVTTDNPYIIEVDTKGNEYIFLHSIFISANSYYVDENNKWTIDGRYRYFTGPFQTIGNTFPDFIIAGNHRENINQAFGIVFGQSGGGVLSFGLRMVKVGSPPNLTIRTFGIFYSYIFV